MTCVLVWNVTVSSMLLCHSDRNVTVSNSSVCFSRSTKQRRGKWKLQSLVTPKFHQIRLQRVSTDRFQSKSICVPPVGCGSLQSVTAPSAAETQSFYFIQMPERDATIEHGADCAGQTKIQHPVN